MFETEVEMAALQGLLERSFAGSGAHMRSIVTAERRLTARQVVNYLQGVKHVAFATVSRKGEPSVSPLDGWFLHGRFIAGTSATAVKAAHVRRNPAVSLAHFAGDDIGIWVHGRARALAPDEALFEEYIRAATAAYGSSPLDLGPVVLWEVEPRAMFAYAPDPSKY